MEYLGIDYGKSKVGFAIGNQKLAKPLKVYHYDSHFKLLQEILRIVKKEKTEKIVVGISEGASAQESSGFANMIRNETKLPVHMSDETLSTQDAIIYGIEAGIGHARRKRMEDAFAAAIILQRYLDNLSEDETSKA